MGRWLDGVSSYGSFIQNHLLSASYVTGRPGAWGLVVSKARAAPAREGPSLAAGPLSASLGQSQGQGIRAAQSPLTAPPSPRPVVTG